MKGTGGMGRAIGKLTALKVAALAKTTERKIYGDGGGLYLQITPGGASWVFRYKRSNRLREAGLGSLTTWSLAEARDRARKMRQQVDDGIDPIDARKAERAAQRLEAAKAMSFRQCTEAYIKAHQASWGNARHAAQWGASVANYVYPVFGDLPVAAVDVGLVMKAIEPIWSTKPETASRVRGRIESVLDWATVRKYREGENPARWRGHLESLLPAPAKAKRAVRLAKGHDEHHAALPYAEIGEFMGELRQQVGIPARALEFAILTAGRSGEIMGARWDEIDLANHLWVIPGSRMKAGKEHRVPLSDEALAMLKAMREQCTGDLVFRGARPLNNRSMLDVLERMGRDGLTVHGFRSTFSDWAAERTSYPAELREMALAHSVGDKTEQAYRRTDQFEKRRAVMRDWAKFCAQPMPARGGDNVRPIRVA
jgi:integrase